MSKLGVNQAVKLIGRRRVEDDWWYTRWGGSNIRLSLFDESSSSSIPHIKVWRTGRLETAHATHTAHSSHSTHASRRALLLRCLDDSNLSGTEQ